MPPAIPAIDNSFAPQPLDGAVEQSMPASAREPTRMAAGAVNPNERAREPDSRAGGGGGDLRGRPDRRRPSRASTTRLMTCVGS
jgi:hypothetical protein